MEHDPLCNAGPDDYGWQPPCVALTRTDWDEADYPTCSYCWGREDNCKCQCDLIREVRKDERGKQRAVSSGALKRSAWKSGYLEGRREQRDGLPLPDWALRESLRNQRGAGDGR